MRKAILINLIGTFLLIIWGSLAVFSQTTEFSYQGFLDDTNASANGNYDFEFRYYDIAAGGTPLGTPQQRLNVEVKNGVFSVVLDFGPIPLSNSGPNDFYLEIAVRPTGGGAFTTLSPRSKLLSTPFAAVSNYSLESNNANNATNATNAQTAQNATQLGGVAADQFVQTNDPRLTDERNPLPGSLNYIANSTQTTTGNFNISGDGTTGGTLTANSVSATVSFKIGGIRVLETPGSFNLFAGKGAGTGSTGTGNSFFGSNAGIFSTTGSNNTFSGFEAGRNTSTGTRNSFFGKDAGRSNSTGSENAFFGTDAGDTNTFGENNTIIGYNADVGSTNLSNSTALGNKSFVESSNSLILGSVNGKNGATSDIKVGIGTTAPNASLDIENQDFGSTLVLKKFGDFVDINVKSSGGTKSAPTASLDNQALFLLGVNGYTGSGFSTNGAALIQISADENWTSTANGTSMVFSTTLNGTLDRSIRMKISNDGNVGIGTTNPAQKLDVNGNVRVGTGTTGCVEDSNGTVIAGVCSSDLRFKKNIKPFGNVLNSFSKLRPVNYYWRTDEFTDKHFGSKQAYGLIAQEVEEAFPDLVVTDEKGYKAVNYSKLPLYTIQAVNELKTENDYLKSQVETQRNQLEKQQIEINELKKAINSVKEKLENTDNSDQTKSVYQKSETELSETENRQSDGEIN